MSRRAHARSGPVRAALLAALVLLAAAFALWGRGGGSDTVGERSGSASSTSSTAPPSSAASSRSPGGVRTARPSRAPSTHWDRGPEGEQPSRGATDPASGLAWIEESELPAQGRDTLELIDDGGPFPYPGKDGSTFGNFERLLPTRPRGYYAEYTVPTPGERDRGARRIIVGDGGELYWTADHYESFERIRRAAR